MLPLIASGIINDELIKKYEMTIKIKFLKSQMMYQPKSREEKQKHNNTANHIRQKLIKPKKMN